MCVRMRMYMCVRLSTHHRLHQYIPSHGPPLYRPSHADTTHHHSILAKLAPFEGGFNEAMAKVHVALAGAAHGVFDVCEDAITVLSSCLNPTQCRANNAIAVLQDADDPIAMIMPHIKTMPTMRGVYWCDEMMHFDRTLTHTVFMILACPAIIPRVEITLLLEMVLDNFMALSVYDDVMFDMHAYLEHLAKSFPPKCECDCGVRVCACVYLSVAFPHVLLGCMHRGCWCNRPRPHGRTQDVQAKQEGEGVVRKFHC